MKNALSDFAQRAHTTFLEGLLLVALGLLAMKFAAVFPADKHFGAASASSEKNPMLSWHAHQLFQRGPDELSEAELHDVERWCRCVELTARYLSNGLQSLTDDECRLLVETLSDLCPNLAEHRGYFPVYEACRRRLAGEVPARQVFSRHEASFRDDAPLLE